MSSVTPISPTVIKERRTALLNIAVGLINDIISKPTESTEYISHPIFCAKVDMLSNTHHEKFLIKTLFEDMVTIFKEADWDIKMITDNQTDYLVIDYKSLIKSSAK